MSSRADTYETAIIGGGMAGLAAAIYSLRYRLRTVLFAREPGGIITESALVENWPGETGISGIELMEKVRAHAASLGAEFVNGQVESVSGGAGAFVVKTSDGKERSAFAVVLALGSDRRKLDVPGEKEFAGRGVSYCATCDGFFFRGKTVAVVGGSDSAAASAELLANMAEKVYVLYRRDELRAEPIRVERLKAAPNVEIITNTVIEEISGDEAVTAVSLNGGRTLAVDGVFVEIGFDPSTKLAAPLGLQLDEAGFIVVDEACRTNVPGVYAAGDVTTGTNRMRQLVTAAAEGAIAAESCFEDLRKRPIMH